MENENPTSGQCPNSDIISNIPQNIIESILSLMPLREAVRTSVLSKKWRYRWWSMPKLAITYNMLNPTSVQLMKYEYVKVIFHVLLLHNGPEIFEFQLSVARLHMESEFAQIMSYLAKGNKLKQLIFHNDDDNSSYKLPDSFFLMQGLELVTLSNCTFEPPLEFNIFSRLKTIQFVNAELSAQMLQRFLCKCPLLEQIHLVGAQEDIEFVEAGNRFTFVDLLQCVPLVKDLEISKYYMKYLCAGGMPCNLPTSPAHLEILFLDVCLTEQDEISSTIRIIMNSRVLQGISFMMHDNDKLPVRQTPANFLDPEDYPNLILDHLEALEIENFGNLPLEVEFVKLIMAKSPILKGVRIELDANVSVDEELKILRDMLLLLSCPRPSPSAKLFVERSKHAYFLDSR